MSASLVGSEMCIRDRDSWAPLSTECQATDSCAAEAAPCLRLEGERRDPVSYTHLTLPTICSV
eukprot:280818-Alexandrium_andersonii.AAC.1